MVIIDNKIENRVDRIERFLNLNGIHNQCDRCGKLDSVLFKVCGTFSGERQYCFRCISIIYIIDIKYWIIKKLFPIRKSINQTLTTFK